MKAIEKILDILPVPLLAAAAFVVFVTWVFKELNHQSYGDVFRTPTFQAITVVTAAIVVVCYAMTAIFSQLRPFNPDERGILVATFLNDSENSVRTHTIESLKTRLEDVSGVSDVKFRTIDKCP